jgi:hypothetical protein
MLPVMERKWSRINTSKPNRKERRLERILEVRTLRAAGKTLAEIASIIGYSDSKVSDLLSQKVIPKYTI